MATAVFVSDIHITSPECPRGHLFESFLRGLEGGRNLTHLYLLGDIFDLWVADHRYFVERYHSVIAEIRRLRSEGVAIAYFEGNHDLHLESFWQDELGVSVYPGPTYVEHDGKMLRIEHGDQMDPDDRGYRFLRWFLRTPPIRWLICNLPGALIRRVGERASATSREYTSQTKTIEPDQAIAKIRAHAQRAFEARPFDIILSGHVHIRDDCEIDAGSRRFRSINLGSWLDAPCFFRIDNGIGTLHELAKE
jgi:UDP-2,3-diacylglucosamine hydrolase